MSTALHDDLLRQAFGDRGEKLSVIIPTYNCAKYLGEAISSVKAELARGFDGAQIVVVDDCSAIDDPKKVVQQVWGSQVLFHRNERNLGPCENFNFCLDLADREWIHLLHGDDFVLPGCYAEFARLVAAYPTLKAAFARCRIISEPGEFICESPVLGDASCGFLAYKSSTWSRNPIYPAGVLLSKVSTKTVGGFDSHFTHVQDWNLWWRLARTEECVYSNKVVAVYRESDSSHSSTLRRTGRNVAEALEQVARVIASAKGNKRWSHEEADDYYQGVFEIALNQCRSYLGEWKAFAANWRFFSLMPSSLRKRHCQVLREVRRSHWKKMLRNWTNAVVGSRDV